MRLTTLLLAATAAIALAAGAAQAKQLVYCSEASPVHFDPGPLTGGNDFDASARTIYNRLVEFSHGGTDVTPGLAESWDASADGLEYTFHLRPGVKFHTTSYFTPTRDLNADDVIFSFERQYKADNSYNAYLAGLSWDYFGAMAMNTLIKEIVKIDDLTVKFVLNTPESPFVANMGMDFGSIVSKEYADQLEAAGTKELLASQPIGTGPFVFVDYQLDSVIRYAAFADYWAGKVAIDDLIFAITPDSAVRMQKLQAGECDIAPYPLPADVPALQADANLTVGEQAGLNIAYMAYNVTQPPFDKKEVRQALNMAVNKQAILEAVYQGAGQSAKNLIPPTMWSYNNDIPDTEYNPDKAKEMLAAAGVSNLSFDLWTIPIARSYNPNDQRVSELMQADFAAVGVTANIYTEDWSVYRTNGAAASRVGPFQIGWGGDNGDPDNFFAVLFGCAAIGTQNYSLWCNPEFEDLIQKAKQETDQAKRAELYTQAQVVFHEEAPALLLAHTTIFMPMNKKVIGYTMDPLGIHRFDNVDVTE